RRRRRATELRLRWRAGRSVHDQHREQLIRPVTATTGSRARRAVAIWWCTIVMLGGGALAAQDRPSTFDECQPPAGEDWTYDRLMCVRRVGSQLGIRDEAVRRLRTLGA